MTEDQEQDRGRRPPSKESAALTASERVFLRISVWQTVLSVVGLFVGAVALYAALTESEAVRRQTAASVWPYVQVTTSDYEGPDGAQFRVSLTNAGVGPAHLRGMRLTLGGTPQRTWEDVIRSIGDGELRPFSQTSALNRVIRPGEDIELFGVADRDLTRALRTAVASGEAALEYCYCSIFEQCWVADSRTPNVRPQSVNRCPDYGDGQFQGATAPPPN